MDITGTLIAYYFYCHRRMWLHTNGIRFEDTSEDVEMGVLIEETSYNHRTSKYEQISLGSIKIDFYDAKNRIIHETKKSSKFHETHIWQLKYYILMLEEVGVNNVSGILEYPQERKTEKVELSENDKNKLNEIVETITNLLISDDCPPRIISPKCKNCSYFDFCWSGEE
jgi:CRISPR-associated exonuclease Cas4